MIRLLSVAIECLSSIVFLMPAMIGLQYVILKQYHFNKFIMVLIFALYSTAIFSVTGIPTAYTLETDFNCNLIPLIDIVHNPIDYIKNTILNIILFMPIGFLLPVIWKEYHSIRKTIFTGFTMSIAIELLQIFTFRLTDIDDLITNTLGTILGYHIAKICLVHLPVRICESNKNNSVKNEPVVILILTFLISFFLKPLVVNIMWDFVLSSSFWENIK